MGLWRTAVLLLFAVAEIQAQARRKLVVLFVDGLDARYLRDADKLHLKIPVLRKMAKQGAVADGVVGVMPDDTWSAATTVITGVSPSTHHINTKDGTAQLPAARTLWQAASSDRLKTALMFWPATAGARSDYNCPLIWDGHPELDPAFETVADKCTPGFAQRVSSVYPVFSKAQWNDSTSLTGLRYLLQYDSPDLALIHIADLGQEEGETGAMSLYAREVLETDDEMIGQTLTNLPPHTQVAIVSDHGFETEDYIVRPRVLIGSKTVQVHSGVIGATSIRDAAALRKFVGSRRSGIAREIPIKQVQDSIPGVSGWVAAFATMTNHVASESETGRAMSSGSHKGVHDFWPLRANFRSALIFSGDEIRPTHLGEVSILRVAPTLADILGVKLPDAHAASLWPDFKK